jgi:hypothetical protein
MVISPFGKLEVTKFGRSGTKFFFVEIRRQLFYLAFLKRINNGGKKSERKFSGKFGKFWA